MNCNIAINARLPKRPAAMAHAAWLRVAMKRGGDGGKCS
jgi:hypothetical protein